MRVLMVKTSHVPWIDRAGISIFAYAVGSERN